MRRMEGNDLELVQRAKAGDSDAFRELVDSHSRRAFRTAFRLTRNQENAEDVVQETFLRAYRKLRMFDAKSQFGTWLHRITVNCAMDLMRKESRRMARESTEEKSVLPTVAADDPRPDRLTESSEIGRAVGRVLRHLSPAERTAFLLRHFEGRSSTEIAGILGISSGATRNAIFRAVRKLRSALGPMMEESSEANPG